MSGFLTRAPALGLTVRPTPPRSRRAGASAAVGQWVMLLVALAGLFAMHGLSDHGAGTAVALSHSTASHPIGQAGEHGMTAESGQQTASVAEAVGVNENGVGHDDHGGLLVGVCLAVMAAVLLLGGWVACRTRSVAWAREVQFHLARVAAAISARARGPAAPGLRLLCIQRC